MQTEKAGDKCEQSACENLEVENNALMQQKAECGLQLVFTLGTKGLAKLQRRRWGVSRRTR